MPTRLLREGINSSDRVNSLSQGAELLYRRLFSVADDYGRYHGNATTVRAGCWPTCPEKFRDQDVRRWLKECSSGEKPLILSYEVNGVSYLQITEFGQQIRSKSKFPAPSEQTVRELLANCSQPDNSLLADCKQNDRTSRSRITESKAKAEENICASDDARLSVDEPPFDPTEPDALFPVEPPAPKIDPREQWFSAWWEEYWLKRAKKAAHKAFLKSVKTEAMYERVLAEMRKQKPEMMSREPEKRPHGATWLNGERWEDETPVANVVIPAAHKVDAVKALALQNLQRTGRML